MLILPSILLSLLLGLLLVACNMRRTGKSLICFFLCLAVLLGLGASTCVLWGCYLTVGPQMLPFLSSLLIICLLLAFARHYRWFPKTGMSAVKTSSVAWWELLLFFSVAAAVVLAVGVFAWNNPHGEEDSYIMWNMRAKFLSTAGLHWHDSFSRTIFWSNPDYPILLPLLIAMGWLSLGFQPTIVPVIVSIVFGFLSAALLLSIVWTLRGGRQALLSTAILITTPLFIKESASQMADIPLGCYMLATLALFVLADRFRIYRHHALFLAGLSSALAAWTKNEGLLFLAICLLVRFITSLRLRGLRECFKEMLFFASGAVCVFFTILSFKLGVAPSGYLTTQQTPSGLFTKLLDPLRYFLILKTFVIEAIYWGSWFVNPTPLLVIYYLGLGFNKTKRNLAIITTPVAIVLVMYFGYAAFYLITPLDLNWQLQTSLYRLYLQLWPSFLFCCALLSRHQERCANQYLVPNANDSN